MRASIAQWDGCGRASRPLGHSATDRTPPTLPRRSASCEVAVRSRTNRSRDELVQNSRVRDKLKGNTLLYMARGFESKDVEFQQSEADRLRTSRRSLTPEEHAREQERHSLELALRSVRAERDAARNPHHRHTLDQSIEALEEQLASAR